MQEMRAGPGPSSTRSLLQSHYSVRSGRSSPPAATARRHQHGGPTCCQQSEAGAMQASSRPNHRSSRTMTASRACSSTWSSCQQLGGHTAGSPQQSALPLPVAAVHQRVHRRTCSPAAAAAAAASQHPAAGCLHRMRGHHAGLCPSKASRLSPPSASLAFAEPATTTAAAAVVGTASGASTAAATAAGGLSFSQVLAVVLGYCVMAGSLFRSVPQIVKVIKHNSTEGLSLVSYLVELCCYSVVIAYNISQGYGFNTFGEVVACWIQDVILIALVFRDRHTSPWLVLLTAAAVTAGCSFLLSPACPHELLAAMQASNIAIMALGSRLPQIVLNMKRGNAGMLSVTTCLLNVAGNAARIFTTIVLTGDMLMLGGACSQGCLNTILLWQSISTARARASSGGSSSSSSAGKPGAQQQQQRPTDVRPPPGSSEGPAAGGFPALPAAA